MFMIYHNNRCSKSRQALRLLNENGIEPTVVHYLDTPPSTDTLREILKKLGTHNIRQIMRVNEEIYKTLSLFNPELSDDALYDAIANHPKLLQRPIIVKGAHAVIGRPPENILKLIEAS